MKTKVFTLVSILLLSCTAAFVSCKKNDNTGDSQQQATVKFDDATYIMSQFAEWDDDGNLLFRTKGYTLNEADDTEVSLCVETWGEALSMFKEWMPEGADYTETATSLTWRMTDGFGKPQGEAVLNKVTNGTMVAEAKLPSNIPFVRTIRFIPKDKWPENKNDFVFFDIISADDLLADYWAGNIVEIEKPTHHGTGKFVVMRDFDNETNEKGLLMRLPKNHKSDLVSETLTGGWESIALIWIFGIRLWKKPILTPATTIISAGTADTIGGMDTNTRKLTLKQVTAQTLIPGIPISESAGPTISGWKRIKMVYFS